MNTQMRADSYLSSDFQMNDEDGFTPEIKQRVLLACLFALCVGNMMMQNVASFLPTYVTQEKQNGRTIMATI